jgi:DNA-directed RNA polymerase specialized sigma24 family protein
LTSSNAGSSSCVNFAGLTIEETAEVLHVSASTVKREWEIARTWLYQRMKEHG